MSDSNRTASYQTRKEKRSKGPVAGFLAFIRFQAPVDTDGLNNVFTNGIQYELLLMAEIRQTSW